MTGLRLRDAEQIAANRLDRGGDGSLKDALADVIANGTPRDDIERLTDRIGAAQAAYIAPSDAPTLPFLAEGPNFGFGGETKEQTLADPPQWSEARATVAAELADMQSQPLFLQTDQQQLGGGTHWQPTEQDAEPYHPVHQEPAQTSSPRRHLFFEPPLPAASQLSRRSRRRRCQSRPWRRAIPPSRRSTPRWMQPPSSPPMRMPQPPRSRASPACCRRIGAPRR